MKTTWETPRILVQEFEANEYVAACWGVACKVGNGSYGKYGDQDGWNYWGGTAPYGNNCHDHTGSCSHAENNQFRVSGNSVSFYAESSSDQGSLNGGYTNYIDNNNNGKIDGGDTIFWYTLSGNRDRRWNHYGTVVNADDRHPNRS